MYNQKKQMINNDKNNEFDKVFISLINFGVYIYLINYSIK